MSPDQKQRKRPSADQSVRTMDAAGRVLVQLLLGALAGGRTPVHSVRVVADRHVGDLSSVRRPDRSRIRRRIRRDGRALPCRDVERPDILRVAVGIDLDHGEPRAIGRERRLRVRPRLPDAAHHGPLPIEDRQLLQSAALSLLSGEKTPERAILPARGNRRLVARGERRLERRHIGLLQDLERESHGPHFVERLLAPQRTPRRVDGIAWIVGRVVVASSVTSMRVPFGQGERLLVDVAVLPVEVPVVDPEQRRVDPSGSVAVAFISLAR